MTRLEPRSYTFLTSNGGPYHRNRQQLRDLHTRPVRLSWADQQADPHGQINRPTLMGRSTGRLSWADQQADSHGQINRPTLTGRSTGRLSWADQQTDPHGQINRPTLTGRSTGRPSWADQQADPHGQINRPILMGRSTGRLERHSAPEPATTHPGINTYTNTWQLPWPQRRQLSLPSEQPSDVQTNRQRHPQDSLKARD